MSSLKRSNQPDVVTNSVSSPDTAEEISRLEALCETRTKQLNIARMQLRTGVTGFEAMTVLVNYLTHEVSYPQVFSPTPPRPWGPSRVLAPRPWGPSRVLAPRPWGPSRVLAPRPWGPSRVLAPRPWGPSRVLAPRPWGPSRVLAPRPWGPSSVLASRPWGPSRVLVTLFKRSGPSVDQFHVFQKDFVSYSNSFLQTVFSNHLSFCRQGFHQLVTHSALYYKSLAFQGGKGHRCLWHGMLYICQH